MFVYSCDMGLVKSQSEIYEFAPEQLGMTSPHCLMTGDSQRCDIDAPLALGLRVLLLRPSQSGEVGNAVQSLTELPRFLGRN